MMIENNYGLSAYLKDKALLLLMQAACMLGSLFFLWACGMEKNQLILYDIAWICLLLIWLLTDYLARRNYFQEVQKELAALDKPYLISQVMPSSFRLEDKIYRDILRKSNKSVIDAIHHLETEQEEYKEFIENWIHEVKLPLTAMYLICENEKDETVRRFRTHLTELEHDVEKALYYARSDTVYQDYMIRKINLRKTVTEAVQKNRAYLMKNRVSVRVDCSDISVYCDDKWLIFILSQILWNAAKYKKENGCEIVMDVQKKDNRVILTVEDNGIGIKKEELGRIFEKGFTGTNGRNEKYSTGIGLYLCRKLCRKLGIELEAESNEGEGTKLCLNIPDGSSYFSRST